MQVKHLTELYNKAKETERGARRYYTLKDLLKDSKSYIKDIKKSNVIMSMKVSSSGMTRRFNSLHYNMLLNICYNGKMSWDEVKVGGCGMDMHWHLLFRTCKDILGYKTVEARGLNGRCSGQPLL